MNLSNLMKSIQFTLLRGSGIQVDPAQLGLKIKGASGQKQTGFAALLNRTGQGNNTGIAMPTPPTPPTDPTDLTAQEAYNKALLAYNQEFQAYNTRLMQLLMARFDQLSQSIVSVNNNRNNQSQAISRSVGGVGGIFDTADS